MQWAALNDGGRVADPASAASARVTSEAEESRLTSSYEAALYFIRDGNHEDAARELRGILEHPMMSEAPTHRIVASLRREVGGTPVTLTPTMTQIKFLSLKNLGRLVADLADEAEARGEPFAAPAAADGARERNARLESLVPKTRKHAAAAASAASGPGGGPAVDEDEPYGLSLRCYAAAVEIDGTDAGLWRTLGALAARRGVPHLARHALEMGLAVHPRNPLVLEDLAETLLAVGDFPAVRHVASLISALDPRHARAARMKRAPETLEPAEAFRAIAKRAKTADADADDAAMMQLSSPEQQRAQAEAARKQSFAKSREESSRLACERDVARAKQRGSHVFPVATAEALCARLVRRPC